MKCPMNVVVFFTLFFLFLKWVRKNNTCLPLVMAAQHCVFYAQQLSLQQSFIKHPWSKYLTWLLKSFSKTISFHEELQNLTPFFKKKMQDVSINTFCWLMSPGSSVPGVPVCPVERAGKHKTRTKPMIIGERLCLQRASRNLWWPPIFHRWDCENKIRQPYGVTWEWAKCSEMSWVSDQRWSVVTVENE